MRRLMGNMGESSEQKERREKKERMDTALSYILETREKKERMDPAQLYILASREKGARERERERRSRTDVVERQAKEERRQRERVREGRFNQPSPGGLRYKVRPAEETASYRSGDDSSRHNSSDSDLDDLGPSDLASDGEGPLHLSHPSQRLAPMSPQQSQWGTIRQGARAFVDLCNKDTISKDNTIGEEARMDDLLARYGRKVTRLRHLHRPGDESADNSKEIHPPSKVRRHNDAVWRQRVEVRGDDPQQNLYGETNAKMKSEKMLPSPSSVSVSNSSDDSDMTRSSSSLRRDKDASRRRKEEARSEAEKAWWEERLEIKNAKEDAQIARKPATPRYSPRVTPPRYWSSQDEGEVSDDVGDPTARAYPGGSSQMQDGPNGRYRQESEVYRSEFGRNR